MGVEGDGSRPGGGESLKRWRRRRVAVGGVQEGRGAAEGGKQRGERGRERAEGSEREGKTEEGGQRGPGRGRGGGGWGGEGRERDFENASRSRGLRRALLFDSGRAAAENTNGRIMKMTSCDAAATLARRDSFEQ